MLLPFVQEFHNLTFLVYYVTNERFAHAFISKFNKRGGVKINGGVSEKMENGGCGGGRLISTVIT